MNYIFVHLLDNKVFYTILISIKMNKYYNILKWKNGSKGTVAM